MKRSFSFLFLLILLTSCEHRPHPFRHRVDTKVKPWTTEPTLRPGDDFTFAIVGDLHGGEREHIFTIAIEQLNLLQPAFVLSVGDLIDGGIEDRDELKRQFDFVDERLAKLKAPFFYVVGNHDITNMTMRRYWEERFGRRYYYFLYQNTLFLVLDTEDYSEARIQEIYHARAEAIKMLDGPNPEQARLSDYYKMNERGTGEIGKEQSAYFEKVITEHPHVRWIFLFMHKPVWKREEPGNLSGIEKALENRNYTLINGHLHEYSYTERLGRDYLMLATTGGSQNPLSNNAYDHITLVNMNDDGPLIANIRMDGLLNKTGAIPMDGDTLCFQASKCR
jgi:predicted phosphodiesterase